MLGYNYPGQRVVRGQLQQSVRQTASCSSRDAAPAGPAGLLRPRLALGLLTAGGTRRGRMLTALSIRDVVLIERLDLSFGPGLTVLTGETGAGKSILLDSLGLALGARADAGLVRAGAEQASVTACFAPPAGHPVATLLAEQGLEAEDEVVLRRV